MDFMKYRVKNMEAFKDGTILGGRFLKPGEILEVSEADYTKIVNSGGVLETLETVIPNPKKTVEAIGATLVKLEKEIIEEKAVEEAEDKKEVQVQKKRPGRPRKVS